MKINIGPKLFFGFVVIVCLNASFLLIMSRLSALNTIASILQKQSEMKNRLLRISNLHVNQNRSRLIHGTLHKNEYVENFVKTGSQTFLMADSVVSNLRGIRRMDSLVSETGELGPALAELNEVIRENVLSNNAAYNKGFVELTKFSGEKRDIQTRRKTAALKNMIDDADVGLRSGLAAADSLIAIQTMTRIDEIRNRVDNMNRLTQLIVLGTSVFSLFFAFVFSRMISNSMRRLREATRVIAGGNFNFDPKGYPHDEIGDLATAFFDMAYDLKKAQQELVKSKRLAAIGEVVASVNHEINNPLMIISGNAQFLEMIMQDDYPDDIKQRVRAILEETERISQVTRKLRDIKNPVVEDYTSSGEQMINLDKSTG